MSVFANNIRWLRLKKRLTQEQLAFELDVSQQTVSQWERDIAKPRTDDLVRIAEFYKCSIDYLLTNKEDSA